MSMYNKKSIKDVDVKKHRISLTRKGMNTSKG